MWKLTFTLAPYLAFLINFLFLHRTFAKISTWQKIVLFLIGLFCASKFPIYSLFSDNSFTPNLPSGAIYFLNWAEFIIYFLVPFSFISVFIPKKFRFKFALFSIILCAGISLKVIYNAICAPEVVCHEVELKNLPEKFEGYTIAHLSDIHCSPMIRGSKVSEIVEIVNRQKPDLIAITGDFVDGTFFDRAKDMQSLTKLTAKDGVYACTGNHEIYWDFSDWEQFYKKAGICFLRDESVAIRKDGSYILLGGIDDTVFGFDKRKLKKIFDGEDGSVKILLAHKPKLAKILVSNTKSDIILSGHTHGGIVPVVSSVVKKANGGFVRGRYRLQGSHLFVSPGTGQWAGFPARIFNPSEITILKLTAGKKKAQ